MEINTENGSCEIFRDGPAVGKLRPNLRARKTKNRLFNKTIMLITHDDYFIIIYMAALM